MPNTYARDHAAYQRPDLTDAVVLQHGPQAGRERVRQAGVHSRRAPRCSATCRRATPSFRYTPDVHADIAERRSRGRSSTPKPGVTYAFDAPLSLYASYGKNTREPARNDMFAGFDNLDTLERGVRRRPGSRETGDRPRPGSRQQRTTGGASTAGRSSTRWTFENEIAPIGLLSYLGNPLRKNVGASYRRGVEVDVTLPPAPPAPARDERRREHQPDSRVRRLDGRSSR